MIMGMHMNVNSGDIMIDDDKVKEIVPRIVEVGCPKKIAVFGSHATGYANKRCGFDLLVVVDDDVENARLESVRILRALK